MHVLFAILLLACGGLFWASLAAARHIHVAGRRRRAGRRLSSAAMAGNVKHSPPPAVPEEEIDPMSEVASAVLDLSAIVGAIGPRTSHVRSASRGAKSSVEAGAETVKQTRSAPHLQGRAFAFSEVAEPLPAAPHLHAKARNSHAHG